VMLTGLVADGLLARLKPSPERPWAFRLFASIVPVVFYLFYFEALLLMKGWWWSVHLWTGGRAGRAAGLAAQVSDLATTGASSGTRPLTSALRARGVCTPAARRGRGRRHG